MHCRDINIASFDTDLNTIYETHFKMTVQIRFWIGTRKWKFLGFTSYFCSLYTITYTTAPTVETVFKDYEYMLPKNCNLQLHKQSVSRDTVLKENDQLELHMTFFDYFKLLFLDGYFQYCPNRIWGYNDLNKTL